MQQVNLFQDDAIKKVSRIWAKVSRKWEAVSRIWATIPSQPVDYQYKTSGKKNLAQNEQQAPFIKGETAMTLSFVAAFRQRMHVRRNADTGGNEHKILDDVLPLKCRRKKTAPGLLR
jgi:hypothetical protein